MNKYQHGGNIYDYENIRHDFSTSINPLGMPANVIRALQDNAPTFCNYPDTECRELKAAVARMEDVPQDCIVFGNGSADLIHRVIMTIRPRTTLLPVPSFLEYEKALVQANSSVQYHYMLFPHALEKENQFRLTQNILFKINEDLDMLILGNPNNPVGNRIGMELLDQIVIKCKENNVHLLIDECFIDFSESREKESFKRYLADNKNIFILKAFTKSFAMAGIRLGHVLSYNTTVLRQIEEIGQPWGVSMPAQVAGVAAVENSEYLTRTVAFVKEQREYLQKSLNDLKLVVYDSDTNFLLIRGPRGLMEKLIPYGILIRDCSNFKGLGEGFYRIAVRTRKENEDLIMAMEEVCTNMF